MVFIFIHLVDFLSEGFFLIRPSYVLSCVMSSDELLHSSSSWRRELKDISKPSCSEESSWARLVRK